jgi:chromosome condensin MukBEF ATPase and DNA-binding subunit MukB
VRVTTTTVATAHGTYGGYQRHKKKNEPPCDECKAALADYQRAWRARKGAPQWRERVLTRARSRALTVLSRRHSDELREITHEIAAELNAELLAEEAETLRGAADV